MTLWLVIILALFLIWLALAPRGGKAQAPSARAAALTTGALPKHYKPLSPESVRLMVNEALRGREKQHGVATTARLHAFTHWLNALDKQDLQVFAEELNQAAHRSNVNLQWATAGHMPPDLVDALHDVVLFHALGVWRARAFAPLVRLEEYRAHPNTRENRRFAQQVFEKLSQTHPQFVPPQMLLASDKERSQYMEQAILRAWREDQAALIDVVRD